MTVAAEDAAGPSPTFTVGDDQLLRTAIEAGASLAGLAAGAVRSRRHPLWSTIKLSIVASSHALSTLLIAGDFLKAVHRGAADEPMAILAI